MLPIRTIMFFKCVLLFFMNSQFSFSAAKDPAKTDNKICCSAKCIIGATAEESRVERALREAIAENNLHKVGYYFLESRKQVIKHSVWMTYNVLFTTAMYSAGLYYLYSASLDGLSEANNAGMISFLMFLGPIGLVSIGSTARPLNLSRKTKEQAKAYLVENLGAEIFKKIKNLSLTSVGISELINIFLKDDEEEGAKKRSFLEKKLAEHEKQEAARRRCCARAQGDRALLEGELL